MAEVSAKAVVDILLCSVKSSHFPLQTIIQKFRKDISKVYTRSALKLINILPLHHVVFKCDVWSHSSANPQSNPGVLFVSLPQHFRHLAG